MSDKHQTNDTTLLSEYREVVLSYEQIGKEISDLLEANEGGTEKMTDDDYMRYREMARRRDILYDTMKHLEIRLLGDDSD